MRRESAINFQMVAKIMGWLLIIEPVFMLFPLIASLVYGESRCAEAFGIAIAITAALGFTLACCIHPRRTTIRHRECLLLTSLVWALFSLFGSIPFIVTGVLPSFCDAFFEMMSGFSTTGATVIRDVEAVPAGLLLWRSLSQWLGGMGIIIFTLAVLPMLNHQGGVQLFNSEVTGITHDKLKPRVSETTKRLWLVYVVLTLALLVCLWLGPMNFFDALNHTLTTTSTGGFSTKNDSIAFWDSRYIEYVITVFMFLCGINFALLYRFATGNRKALWTNDIFRWYAAILVITALGIAFKMIVAGHYTAVSTVFAKAIFETISVATSTGLSAIDYEMYGGLVSMIVFTLMFFGASAGSTAGGAKIDRLILLLKNTRNEIYHLLHPNSITIIRINDKVVTRDVCSKSLAFLTLYLLITFVGSVVLSAFDFPVFDAFFTSLSMISNIGFGHGVTGSMGSFADLNGFCKLFCSFEMLVGRLELFTVLVVFTKGFWKL